MNRENAETELERIFGIDHFYDEQWEAVRRILNGERILMIQRTGFGKSLCYQFPSTQFEGTSVIFSPLITLMRDQVKALNNKGIPARYINSEQSAEENSSTIQDALDDKVKNAINYNAGHDADTRKDIENGLMHNRYKCVVSTNALGMGIDKPDIRFIIHTKVPASPSERGLIKATNLKQTQIRIIKSDLLDQGIAKEVVTGKSKVLEYQFGASEQLSETIECQRCVLVFVTRRNRRKENHFVGRHL